MSAALQESRPVRSYHLLGMDDFFIDFAGRKPERHPARLALSALKAGDLVQIEERNKHLELVNKESVSLARLSKKARSDWGGRLQEIKEVRIIAMVRRYQEDRAGADFQATCHGAFWEVPIVELVC